MANIFMSIISLLNIGVYRLAMANTHFYEPYFILDFVPECGISRSRKFVRCTDEIRNFWILWIGLNRLNFYRIKTWDIMAKNQISADRDILRLTKKSKKFMYLSNIPIQLGCPRLALCWRYRNNGVRRMFISDSLSGLKTSSWRLPKAA